MCLAQYSSEHIRKSTASYQAGKQFVDPWRLFTEIGALCVKVIRPHTHANRKPDHTYRTRVQEGHLVSWCLNNFSSGRRKCGLQTRLGGHRGFTQNYGVFAADAVNNCMLFRDDEIRQETAPSPQDRRPEGVCSSSKVSLCLKCCYFAFKTRPGCTHVPYDTLITCLQ